MKEDSQSRRYDRILCNSRVLRPVHVELFGTAPCTVHAPPPQPWAPPVARPLHLSDHYGVLCVCVLDVPPDPSSGGSGAPFFHYLEEILAQERPP